MMLAYTTTVEVKLLYSLFFLGCKHSSIRLVEPSLLEGHLEVCNYGVWATVCGFEELDANVACRQLGYSSLGN